jgi:hypothetical protein
VFDIEQRAHASYCLGFVNHFSLLNCTHTVHSSFLTHGVNGSLQYEGLRATLGWCSCLRLGWFAVTMSIVLLLLLLQIRTQPHLGCCLAAATSAASAIFMHLCTNNATPYTSRQHMRSCNDVNGNCANRRSRLTTEVAGHEKRRWASSSTGRSCIPNVCMRPHSRACAGHRPLTRLPLGTLTWPQLLSSVRYCMLFRTG